MNAPKGTLTTDLRSQIADRKGELLKFLRDQVASASSGAPPIPRRVSKDPAPLSFAQERLWFLEQLEPGSAVYNICRASRLTGQLNIAALEASLTEILRRHDILRSQIRIVDGRLVQITVAVSRFEVPVTDLRSLTETKCDVEVARLITHEARRPFDLAAGLWLRATLLRLADNDHILILATHHIVSDAWSMGILTRELWTLYEAFAKEKPSPLEDLPIQYADYAVWQREWLQEEVLGAQLSYWRKQLENIPMLNLPTDRARPAKQSFRGARQPISLPESLTAAINELSRREGVTQFMALLAAFQILLYRYTGQEDVVVGSPIANRNRTEVEGLIGFFVNTLVLRTDLSQKPTFKELLQHVRNVCLGAYAHQDLPFEKLVQELQPRRDLSRNPLFQVMFILQNATRPLPGISGISFEPMQIESGTSQVDLALFLRERDGKVIGFFEYSTDLFDRATIERMIGNFQTLLEGIIAKPDQPIATLSLLTEAERHQLLIEWNDTEAEYSKESCIHELFEAQVGRTPDAVAVEFEGKQITYGELNNRANQLAHYLRGLGVGREKLVGIYVERSLEMVIGLLGILKAGGAYVPLDPTYPKERIAFILEDAHVSLLLIQKRLVAKLPRCEALSVCLDDIDLAAQESKENLRNEAKPDGAAYIIYTSGSTGTPKGVVGLHRGAVNRFNWMWKTFPFRSYEKSCLKTSLSFVDSVWEVFGPLLQGIPTAIVPDQVAKDPQRLVRALSNKRVTRIVLVPSMLQAILGTFPNLQRNLPNLTLWSSSGEYLSNELAERFRRALPNSTLLNLYGSSEVSADVTYHDSRRGRPGSEIPIGRPISNTQIYLLDSQLQLVPIGVRGELYVGGAGLARGYLDRPELTAEKFIADPFGSEPALYRTGDFARYLPDGNIEFLGRVDDQIKIRGYRIELGEIETVLKLHPAIQESMVIAQDEVAEEKHGSDNLKSEIGPSRSSGSTLSKIQRVQNPKSDRRLIAYIVPNSTQPSISELRSFLKGRLPDYMVPSGFVILDAFSLTPNGKIDRQGLLPPMTAAAEITQHLFEPRTEIEALVLQIWKDALKQEKVGIHDNFFELGGHSLLGAQIVSVLRATFHKQVSLRALFEAPTVAGLAAKIERIIRGPHKLNLPPIVPVARNGVLPVSMTQEQLFIIDQLLGGPDFLIMPYAYRLTGPLDVPALHRTIQEILRRHEALRTTFTEVEDQPRQIVRRIRKINLPLIDLSHMPPAKLEEKSLHLSRVDAELPFDLNKGPLFRMKLLRLKEDHHVLLVTMHHIVSDQWSMRVFRNELATLYEAFSQGRPSPLPEPSIQFADFVCWQRRLLKSGLLTSQISYWKKQLAGPMPELDFQKGYKRKRKTIRFRSSRQAIQIDEALFGDIKNFACKENCTTFMVLVTALSILVHLYTGKGKIRIGTLVANRGRKGTEGLIGYFVNALILSMHVSPQMTGRKLLKQVRDVSLAAFAHQDLPFEQLESILERKTKRGGPPLFQVMLNYRNFASQPRESDGLTIASWDGYRAVNPGIAISRLDLSFHLRESLTKLTGAVNYKTDIFSEERMAHMIVNFCKVLKHVVLQPRGQVSSFRSIIAR